MATHSGILAWRVPWPKEPGGLQSMGSQRVRHDGVTYAFHFQLLGQTQTNLAPLSPVYWTFSWIS